MPWLKTYTKSLSAKMRSDKHLVFLGRMAVFLSFRSCSTCFQTKQHNIRSCRLCMGWFRGSLRIRLFYLSLFWKKMTNWGALFGMIVGAVTVIIWKNVGLGDTLYEIVPGFVFNLLVAIVVSYITYRKNEAIEEDFHESVSLVKQE